MNVNRGRYSRVALAVLLAGLLAAPVILVLADELITNGSLDTSLSDWTAASGEWTDTVDHTGNSGGAAMIFSTMVPYDVNSCMYQVESLSAGSLDVSFWAVVTDTYPYMRSMVANAGESYAAYISEMVQPDVTWSEYQYTAAITESGTYLLMFCSTSVSVDWAVIFDDISVDYTAAEATPTPSPTTTPAPTATPRYTMTTQTYYTATTSTWTIPGPLLPITFTLSDDPMPWGEDDIITRDLLWYVARVAYTVYHLLPANAWFIFFFILLIVPAGLILYRLMLSPPDL